MTQSTSSSNQTRWKQLSSSFPSIDEGSQTLLSASDPSPNHLQLFSILQMRSMLLCLPRPSLPATAALFMHHRSGWESVYVLAVWARGWQMAIESNLELKWKGVERDSIIKSYVCETRWNFISALTQIQKSLWNFYSLSLCSSSNTNNNKQKLNKSRSWMQGNNFISTITTRGWKEK